MLIWDDCWMIVGWNDSHIDCDLIITILVTTLRENEGQGLYGFHDFDDIDLGKGAVCILVYVLKGKSDKRSL